MFINSYFFEFLGRLLNKPARFLFDISGEYANAFLIGGIAGFPIGAKTVKEVYLTNQDKNEAERTLAFCNNCSISFAVSAVGVAVFGSFRVGLILFGIQLFAAVITGIAVRFIFGVRTVGTVRRAESGAPCKKTNAAFTEILSDSINGIVNICGTVLFFFIAANITFEYLKFIPLFSSDFFKTVISGIFEISSGTNALAGFNAPLYYKLIFASIILSWTGISVHFQVMYTIKNIGLSLKPYFTGKIIHGIISILTAATFFDKANMSEITVSTVTESHIYAYPMILNNFDAYTAGLIITGMISLAMFALAFTGMAVFDKVSKIKKRKDFYEQNN
jgi:hypothetical protein